MDVGSQSQTMSVHQSVGPTSAWVMQARSHGRWSGTRTSEIHATPSSLAACTSARVRDSRTSPSQKHTTGSAGAVHVVG